MTAEANRCVVRVAATLLLVAALPVAPVAAQITQAWSVNLAGVMKVTLPSGTLTQATMPFQPLFAINDNPSAGRLHSQLAKQCEM